MPDQSLGTDHQSSQAVGHVGPSHGEKVAQIEHRVPQVAWQEGN